MIRTRAELKGYLLADLEMSGVGAWRQRYRVTRRVLYFQRLLRRAEYLGARERSGVSRVILAYLKVRLIFLGERVGVAIPRGVFGPGLSVAHGGGIVVNGGARVGARCRIHQGVTLGATNDGAPIVGDDAFFGPNVVVIGPVVIGDAVTVAAGSVVTQSLPPNVVAAGAPARIIRSESLAWHQAIYPVAFD